jgi:hypothetical protein
MASLQGESVFDQRPNGLQTLRRIEREPEFEVRVRHLGERVSDTAGPSGLPDFAALFGSRHGLSLALIPGSTATARYTECKPCNYSGFAARAASMA